MAKQLFTVPFHHYSQVAVSKIRELVQRAKLDEIESLAEQLKSEYTLKELSLEWDSMTVLPKPREEVTFERDVFGDEVRIATPVYTFEVPYSGSSELFDICPSTSRMARISAITHGGKLTFEVHGADKARLEQIKDAVQINVANQSSEVSAHNREVERIVGVAIEQRKEEINKQEDGVNAFGVAIKAESEQRHEW